MRRLETPAFWVVKALGEPFRQVDRLTCVGVVLPPVSFPEIEDDGVEGMICAFRLIGKEGRGPVLPVSEVEILEVPAFGDTTFAVRERIPKIRPDTCAFRLIGKEGRGPVLPVSEVEILEVPAFGDTTFAVRERIPKIRPDRRACQG
jgi:hypothetical protein